MGCQKDFSCGHVRTPELSWLLQISKLLNIPFVALVEKFYLGKTFSPRVVSSMACVVVGVAIVYAILLATV